MDFKRRVYSFVAQIPLGKVSSYGSIAAYCGSPRAARIVGGIAHTGDIALPWHRVVMSDGGLAAGYPGGVSNHQYQLEQEGITFSSGKVIMERHAWRPDHL